MKFQFTTLDHQNDAVAAVLRALKDQPHLAATSSETSAAPFLTPSAKRLPFQERVIANPSATSLDHTLLLENIQAVQKHNNLPPSPSLLTTNAQNNSVPNLSIDMETGTGKTYVYLKTMLELEKHYGYKKFIVITPSIAIREGLLTAIAITRNHFRETYDPFESFAYDAKKLNPVRHFAQSQRLQLMILNVQAFVKDLPQENLENTLARQRSNIIHRAHDRFEGYSPLHLLRATNPILILDEPQSIDSTTKAQRAIAKLNPALILRYSATHKHPYNLLYKLDPIQAYERALVKQIAVASVVPKHHHNDPTIQLLDIKATGNTIKAHIQFQQQQQEGIKDIKKWLAREANLYELSNNRELYKDYVITNISRKTNDEYVTFQKNNLTLRKGQSSGAIAEHIQRQQITECVEQHFKKLLETQRRSIPVKILSLFFIDKVANYRDPSHPQGLGKFALWFEEAFATFQAQPQYKNLIPHPVRNIHNGYFAQDRRGAAKDSQGNLEEQKNAYQLIMRDKEKLLDLNESLQFIFSHSALREGWDNPNVFQICTLNATVSDQKKRQEIGRGLRLPVDQNGVRIQEEREQANNFNRLTIITNESYETFAKALQEEVKNEDGKTIEKPLNANKKTIIRFHKETFLSQDFLKLWERISPLTRYRIDLPEQDIVANAVKRLHTYKAPTPRIVIKASEQNIVEKSLQLTLSEERETKKYLPASFMPEMLVNLQKNTSLPRHVLHQILQRSTSLIEARKNPEAFLQAVSETVQEVMKEFLVQGIRYTKTKKGRYEARDLFTLKDDETLRNHDLIHKVRHKEKTLYDHIVCDSQPEIQAAQNFDIRDNTKVFVKLPRKFVVRTPAGDYNPDWAIIKDTDQQIDLVTIIETKGSDRESERRVKENQKIFCAKKHFKALGVTYDVQSMESFQA